MKFKLCCLLILFIIIVYILKNYNKDTFIDYTSYDKYPVIAGDKIYYLKNYDGGVKVDDNSSNIKAANATFLSTDKGAYYINALRHTVLTNDEIIKKKNYSRSDDLTNSIQVYKDIGNSDIKKWMAPDTPNFIEDLTIKRILYILIYKLFIKLNNALNILFTRHQNGTDWVKWAKDKNAVWERWKLGYFGKGDDSVSRPTKELRIWNLKKIQEDIQQWIKDGDWDKTWPWQGGRVLNWNEKFIYLRDVSNSKCAYDIMDQEGVFSCDVDKACRGAVIGPSTQPRPEGIEQGGRKQQKEYREGSWVENGWINTANTHDVFEGKIQDRLWINSRDFQKLRDNCMFKGSDKKLKDIEKRIRVTGQDYIDKYTRYQKGSLTLTWGELTHALKPDYIVMDVNIPYSHQTAITNITDALKTEIADPLNFLPLEKLIYNSNASIFKKMLNDIFSNTIYVEPEEMRINRWGDGDGNSDDGWWTRSTRAHSAYIPFWTYILHSILGPNLEHLRNKTQTVQKVDKIIKLYIGEKTLSEKISGFINDKIKDIQISEKSTWKNNVELLKTLTREKALDSLPVIATYITAFGDIGDVIEKNKKYIIKKNGTVITVDLEIILNGNNIESLVNRSITVNYYQREYDPETIDYNNIYIYINNSGKFVYRGITDMKKYFKLDGVLYEANVKDNNLQIKQADNNEWKSITITFNKILKKIDLFCGITNYFYIITTTNDDLHQLNKIYNEERSVFKSNTNTFTMNNNDIIDYNIDEGNDTIKIIQS